MTIATEVKSVRIVGAGLLGTSIGLALSKAGVDVSIESASPSSQALAVDYGAGRNATAMDQPDVVFVCVPPDVTAKIVVAKLSEFPNAVVTDVASVKAEILDSIEALGSDSARYVGSHPMAGREKGGAISGRADLFFGRPWVITPNEKNSKSAIALVKNLAIELGSTPILMSAKEHDQAVAMVSHVPQVVSSLLAARLNSAEVDQVSLAGQGLRDTTRIAASDSKLWTQILSANHEAVSAILADYAADLQSLAEALKDPAAPGAISKISAAIEAGNSGVARIPGKHGSKAANYAQIVVMIDDRPGEFGRLLQEVGELEVNIEDLKLEHSPGAQIGLVELSILPNALAKITEGLLAKGWRLAG